MLSTLHRFKSNNVLTTALYAGLAALVRLSKARQNDQTRGFYDSIQDIWAGLRNDQQANGTRNSRSISRLQDAESSLRRLYLDMLWYSTEPYGNKEFKRVYSRREGTIGPLNTFLNFAGAVLRELAVTRYPFPDPVYFQVRKYPDGTVRVLPQALAEKLPAGRATKTYWRAGYRGKAKQPRFLLSHPTLPEMDFVDMIRAHVIEVCRQCFIHNVPYSDAHAYVRLLVHRLKPFLDWVYTGGRTGRKDFWPDADRELRRLTLEIRTFYGRNAGKREGVTRTLDEEFPKQTVDLLRSKAEAAFKRAHDKGTRQKCACILDMIDRGFIVDRDVSKLMGRVTALIQKEGNDWHRVLFSGLHHPQSLRSVVFSGDTMLDGPGQVLLVAELPVATPVGRGQSDLVFFVRRSFSDRAVWTPVMVLELKTMTAVDFNFYSQNRKHGRVPVSYVWKTALSEEEWKRITGSGPSRTTLDQLDAYEQGLLQEYHEMVPDDPTSPASLRKGVVLIDTDQSHSVVLDAFQDLMEHLTSNLRLLESNASGWTCHTLKAGQDDLEKPPRIVVIVSSSRGLSRLVSRVSPQENVSVENPFEHRTRDDRLLTLYISVPSPTSFGGPAAWVSMNWHLLNHLNDCIQTSQHTPKIFWLDLLDDYPTDGLIKARFGLDTLHTKKQITMSQYGNLTRLLNDIEFVRLGSEVDDYLLTAQKLELEALRSATARTKGEETIFVVSGWAELTQLVPRHRAHLTAVLETTLLSALPKNNTNIIWTDRGSPHTRMNALYQCHCVKPLPYDSPRQSQIDEIIWNMPLMPRVIGWQAPRRTDVRMLIQDTPTTAPPSVTVAQVPHLKNWVRKFRGGFGREKTVKQSEVFEATGTRKPAYGRSVSLSSDYAVAGSLIQDIPEKMLQDAMTLAPSLLRPRRGEPLSENGHEERLSSEVESCSLVSTRQPASLTDRMHLCPNRPPPEPNRSEGKYFGLSEATRGWQYGSIPSPDEYVEDWQKVSRRPPLSTSTEHSEIDTLETRRGELRRLLYAARFLKEQVSSTSDLYNCCDAIIDCCENTLREHRDKTGLLEALRQVKKHILNNAERRNTWRLLDQTRLALVEEVDSENRRALHELTGDSEDIMSLYGNNLFLAVYAVAESVLDDTLSLSIIQLWSAVAEWQLYQMGFRPQHDPDGNLTSRYDFQAIYSNLLWRAKALKKAPQPARPQLTERFGQAVWTEHDEFVNVWLVFPDRQRGAIVGGLVLDQGSLVPRLGWHRCVIDPEELRETATTALKTWSRSPILLTSVEGQDVLWMRVEGEAGEDWSCIGLLEYGPPPEHKSHPIRWLRISTPTPEASVEIQGFRPSSPPSDLNRSVDIVLRDAKSWKGTIRDVKCLLTIDVGRNIYRVEFREKTGSEANVLDTRETPSTDEVIGFLRHPQRTGEYPVTRDDIHLRWDCLKDVEYKDVPVEASRGKREWISLTFLKPLIHRHSFFPDHYSVPRTCSELLETRLGREAKLVINVDQELMDQGASKYLKVTLDGVDKKSQIRGLETEAMGIYDVALLAECEQIVDVTAGTRHYLKIDVKGLKGVRVPAGLSEYAKLDDAIIADTEESDAERADLEDREAPENEPEVSGPEMELVSAEAETRDMGSTLRVVVHLGQVDEDEPLADVPVIDLPRETIKVQAIAYEIIVAEVTKGLRGWNVGSQAKQEIIDEVCGVLRREGARISEE